MKEKEQKINKSWKQSIKEEIFTKRGIRMNHMNTLPCTSRKPK